MQLSIIFAMSAGLFDSALTMAAGREIITLSGEIFRYHVLAAFTDIQLHTNWMKLPQEYKHFEN